MEINTLHIYFPLIHNSLGINTLGVLPFRIVPPAPPYKNTKKTWKSQGMWITFYWIYMGIFCYIIYIMLSRLYYSNTLLLQCFYLALEQSEQNVDASTLSQLFTFVNVSGFFRYSQIYFSDSVCLHLYTAPLCYGF